MKFPFFARSENRKSVLDWLVLVAGMALFTLLALPQSLMGSAYFDEGYSAYLAQFDPLTASAYTALDVHPPLYYITLHFWQWLVGDGVGALRFLSIVFAWVALLFGFLIVRRWFGQKAAWLTVVFMALSPLFIRYGGTMRMYTMALALAFSATYVLLRAVGSKDKKWWIAYAVLVAAGMWTNYFMALVWVTHALWFLYEHRKNSDVFKAWKGALIWALVLYLPWLPMLLFRYGEVQANGFWIKPLSLDTITSTITQSVLFRSATDTQAWYAIGLIIMLTLLSVMGRTVYKTFDKQTRSVFRLVLAMSFMPALLLAIGSLPPLRSSYVYRYIIVAAVSCALVLSIVIAHSIAKKQNNLMPKLLLILTMLLFTSGAVHAVQVGNRNLDTNRENRLAQVIDSVHKSDKPALVVLRSPYSYYVGRFYEAPGYDVNFFYDDSLEKIGSTKPLADHPEKSIKNFDDLDRVWLVGEDLRAVSQPQGNWIKREYLVEYDDVTGQVAAAAAYYERVQ